MEIGKSLLDELIEAVTEFTGSEPVGLRRYLRLLSHPDVITKTKAYFDSVDFAHMCTKYQAPWNCAREAEATYQNIKYGWTGGAGGIGVNDDWCENCRAKVFGPAHGFIDPDELRESIGYLVKGESHDV